jgi:hypothetical protein
MNPYDSWLFNHDYVKFLQWVHEADVRRARKTYVAPTAAPRSLFRLLRTWRLKLAQRLQLAEESLLF